MFKKLRKAAARLFNKLADFITPKVKVTAPTGESIRVPSGELPGNPENWVNDDGFDDDLIENAVNEGSYMGHSKSDLIKVLDSFAEYYIQDTWKRLVTVTFFDIQRLKVAIDETDYKQFLDWYQNGGGQELFDDITELNQSYEDSIDVSKISGVNRKLIEVINSIV